MPILLRNATLATMVQGYGLIKEAALVIEGESIAFAGPQTDLPAVYANLPAQDLNGGLVTPALIDCHTHIVFGGDRAEEFEMRLNGASYEAVARAGGGILSTVRAPHELPRSRRFCPRLWPVPTRSSPRVPR